MQYLQWPQGRVYVPMNAIWLEHRLLRPSGEGENGLPVLRVQKS